MGLLLLFWLELLRGAEPIGDPSPAALALNASAAVPLVAQAIQRQTTPQPGGEWVESKELFFGACTSGVELRIPLQTPSPGRWWWVSQLRTPEELRLRLGARDLGVFGTSRAFRESPAGTFHTAIPLDLHGGPETLYVTASDPQGDVLLEVELVPDARLAERIQSHTAHDAWILGVLTIILLVAIYLLWVARLRAYAWYVAYLALGILWVGAKTGMAGALLWPDHPEWNHAVPSFASRVSLALYMLFLRDLVGLRDRFPRLGRVLDFGIAWVALCGLFALCSVALPDFHAEILRRFTPEIMEAPTLLLALGMLGWRARSDVLARRVLIACLPFVGAALYGQIRDFFKPIGIPDQDTTVVFIGAILEHIGTTLVLALDVRRRLDAHAGLVRDFDRRLDDQYRQYRARIGSDLHDDLSQRILAIRLSLHRQMKSAGGVGEEVEAQLQDLADSVREISHQLHPSAHGTPSLQLALSELARAMENPQLAFQLDLAYAKEHLPTVNLELFRIVQESISNAVHHGKTTRIRIATSAQGKGMLLSIQDNGTGLGAKSGGIGLAGIEARARRMGGTFRIAPLDEHGAVVEVWIPVEGG
jgi:signal transduction histidine kinase